jgi:hypothetical protein
VCPAILQEVTFRKDSDALIRQKKQNRSSLEPEAGPAPDIELSAIKK